jgi:NAD+ synthase
VPALTWTGEVTDEEFYFRMPFDVLDLLLYAWARGVPKAEVREVLGLQDEQIERAFGDFESKNRATWHFRVMPPCLPATNET